jgi:hypothetical protein
MVEDVDDGEFEDLRDIGEESEFYDSLNERKELGQTIRRSKTSGKNVLTGNNEMADFTLDSDSALWGFEEHED